MDKAHTHVGDYVFFLLQVAESKNNNEQLKNNIIHARMRLIVAVSLGGRTVRYLSDRPVEYLHS